MLSLASFLHLSLSDAVLEFIATFNQMKCTITLSDLVDFLILDEIMKSNSTICRQFVRKW